jgi:KaiC/GvpD/RAD55 family RecA-like ATPase
MVNESTEELKERANRLMERLGEIIANAKSDDETDVIKPFSFPIDKPKTLLYDSIISKPKEGDEIEKHLEGLKTGTFIDDLYLDETNNLLGGVPIIGQFGLVGLSGVGKSILVQEIAIRLAHSGKRVIFVTSEDSWDSPTARLDLQTRFKQKSDLLKFDWGKIKENLVVFDTILHSEFRSWEEFIGAYRFVVEGKGCDVLIIDSITLMESYRQNLKHRVLELSRYNQTKGITGFYVCQRSEEETDRFAISGGIGVAHNLDSVICIDFAKAMGQLKEDFGVKQWDMVHFCRILSCRLSAFDRRYKKVEITQDGFLKLVT